MYKKVLIGVSSFIALVSYNFIHTVEPDTPEFVILITTYNNERYCEKNLASVAFQHSSKPYRVIIVNDCSTDKTKELLERFVKDHRLESRVTLIHNSTRCYSLKNIYTAIHTYIKDHEIVVSVDGDDQLASNNVLLRLEQEYSNPAIHLTHGGMRYLGSYKKKEAYFKNKMNEAILRAGKVRQNGFKAHHLKTFRAGLFKRIKKEDLMYNNEFLPSAGDVAFMFPMIDMLTPRSENEPLHVSFIRDVLYLYNYDNPINDRKTAFKKQHFFGTRVGTLPPYAPINVEELPRTSAELQ